MTVIVTSNIDADYIMSALQKFNAKEVAIVCDLFWLHQSKEIAEEFNKQGITTVVFLLDTSNPDKVIEVFEKIGVCDDIFIELYGNNSYRTAVIMYYLGCKNTKPGVKLYKMAGGLPVILNLETE